ncbi:helix-turn-helix domain-containing protein [Ancylobacter sonchi]|uniref:AraC family transcriptional regulator n=1 Tax=Ancylobacter sonchi TaxID=1937790 RepID=UPI001BD6643A|nr:AraC family transcriptional regulator [Ancylobacter sonchi]MBS7533428.1 helix-turn-helix domain-containing protein [Ancylobacter sonchi]
MSKLHRVHDGDFGSVSVLELTGELVPHVHSSVNLSFWLAGAPAPLSLNGRAIGHDAETAAVINAFVPHCLKVESAAQTHTLSFYLDPDWLAHHLPAGTPAGFTDLKLPISPALRDELQALADMLINESCDPYEIDCAILVFLKRALAACQVEDAEAAIRERRAKDFRLRKAVALMRENMSRGLDMEEVARAAGLSRPHLFSLFRDQLDLTPGVFWNSLRLEEAVNQMRASEDNLTSIASSLGFTAQCNFTRFFRQHTGVTPSDYRGALPGGPEIRHARGRHWAGCADSAFQTV